MDDIINREFLYFTQIFSQTAWLAGVQLNPVILFPPSQAMSESTIFKWNYKLLRYLNNDINDLPLQDNQLPYKNFWSQGQKATDNGHLYWDSYSFIQSPSIW